MMLANKSLHAAVYHTLQFSLNVNQFLRQLAQFVYVLMYTLFYESPKNWGYYAHALPGLSSGGRGLGTRLLGSARKCMTQIH